MAVTRGLLLRVVGCFLLAEHVCVQSVVQPRAVLHARTSASPRGAVLPRALWAGAAAAHRGRIADLLGDSPAAAFQRRAGHPLLNFVFNYYRQDLKRPGSLELWTPGAGVALEAGGDAEDGTLLWPSSEPSASDGGLVRAYDPSACVKKSLGPLRLARDTLCATRSRAPVWNCHGMHEWAMLYRGEGAPEPLKYQALPLRVDQRTINDAVDAADLVCTHWDAFVRFAEETKPRNSLALSRESQLDHDQPACVHANMDLLKYALRLAPLVPAELIGDCLELAMDARRLDMRASPYDLTDSGLSELDSSPIRVETPAGRREYVHFQSQIHDRAQPIRDALLDAYDRFFLARALASGTPTPPGVLNR